jgi:hypothetical protein
MRFSSLKPQEVLRNSAQHLLVLYMACLNLFFFSCPQALGDGDKAKEMSGMLIGTIIERYGNKRTAFAATYTFLAINGARITADAAYGFIAGLYEAGDFTFCKAPMREAPENLPAAKHGAVLSRVAAHLAAWLRANVAL